MTPLIQTIIISEQNNNTIETLDSYLPLEQLLSVSLYSVINEVLK